MADASQGVILALPAGNGNRVTTKYDMNLGPCTVSRILITWPAGCGGRVFMQILAGGGNAFPNQAGQFLAFDDYTYVVDVTNQTDTGNWSIVSYNLDYIDHDPIVVFEFNYLRGNVTPGSAQAIAL